MNIFGGSSRARRASKRAALNFEEAEAWKYEMLMRCETLLVHTTKWHDVAIFEEWGVMDDFNYFCDVTGLRGFANHPADTSNLHHYFVS
jgi:hypothetical protein